MKLNSTNKRPMCGSKKYKATLSNVKTNPERINLYGLLLCRHKIKIEIKSMNHPSGTPIVTSILSPYKKITK